MTKKQFEAELRRLTRRIQLLHDVSSGKATLRRVDVGPSRVRAHVRGAHTRFIAPAGWGKS